ncbi:MAG TPA: hypothetical protein VEP70_07515 [Burkholderiales bacterium]|nr:hypothetical protein [Burkholderiales bacterium]
MKKALAFLAVFLLGVAVGFPIGARVGLWEFMLGEAQYKASILSTQIKSIKAGKTEPIVVGMEISLNAELAKHGQHMESHFSWLWPGLKSGDDKPIRRAVAYRLANPYEGPDHTKPEAWNPGIDMDSDFVKQVIEGQRTEERYLRKVLEHYGGMAPNSSLQPTPRVGAAERGR